jgi:hypothetical protein
MNVIKLLKRMLGIDRRALSAPILALILLIVGVALAIVVASMAGGFLFGWGTSAKVTIEKADILVNPASGTGFITVDVRNSGGARLTSCTLTLRDPTGEEVTATWTPASVDLNPGQTATLSATGVSDLQSGTIYVVSVTCDGPGGVSVNDQKSASGHI